MADFRQTVAQEDLPTNGGGWFLKAGSVVLPEERVPVYMGAVSGYDNLIGHADNFGREGRNIKADFTLKSSATGVMQMARDGKFLEHYDVTIYGDQLETKSHWSARPIYVDFVRIRAIVVVIPFAANPAMAIGRLGE